MPYGGKRCEAQARVDRRLDSVVVVYPDGNRTEDTRELAPGQVLRELGVQRDDACGAELTPARRALAMLIYAVNDAVFPEQLEADPDSVVMPLPPLDPKEPFVPNLLGLQPVTLPEPEFDLSGLEVGTDDVGDTTRRRRGGK